MSGTPAGPSGEALTVLGTAAAICLAQDRAAEELELLAAFFTALGDNLALIAAQRAGCKIFVRCIAPDGGIR